MRPENGDLTSPDQGVRILPCATQVGTYSIGETPNVSENEQKPVRQITRLRPTNPPEVVLAAGTQASGELKAEGDVRVDGIFEGRIEVVGWVIVGEQARVTADIAARHVQVNGWVRGSVQAVGQVQVGSTGQVWGDVDAVEVFVDPGGQVHSSDEGPPLQPTLPSMPAPKPETPTVEVIPPARHPAREHLRQAEAKARQETLRRWVLSLGVIVAGVLIVCGILVLSGLLPGAAPVPTPTLLAAGPTTAPTRQPTSTPSPTSTALPTATPTHTTAPTATPAPSPTSTAQPTHTPTVPPTAPATSAPTVTAAPATPTPTATAAATAAPATPTPTVTAAPATPTLTATTAPVTPTVSPTSTITAYPFVPDGPVVSEYPNCAPAVVWLRGQVRNATPEQLQYVQVQARHPDGRTLTEPVQPNGSYEVRLYTQGPCPVTLVDSRDGTTLSPTVNVEYADTCNGSAFTLHWKRTE